MGYAIAIILGLFGLATFIGALILPEEENQLIEPEDPK